MAQTFNHLIRFKCRECPYNTLYEGGAADHSTKTGHFVTDAPAINVGQAFGLDMSKAHDNETGATG